MNGQRAYDSARRATRAAVRCGGRLERLVTHHVTAALGGSLALAPADGIEQELDLCSNASAEGLTLDLNAVQTYILLLQHTFGSLCAVFATIVVPYAAHLDDSNGLRSLLVASAVGAFVTARPAVEALSPPAAAAGKHDFAGLDRMLTPALIHLHRSLRLVVTTVLVVLVLESLLYTKCGDDPGSSIRAVELGRGVLELGAVIILMACAVHRALRPSKPLQATVLLAAGALAFLALLPAPRPAHLAPLVKRLSSGEAVERLARTGAFSMVYGATILASAPRTICRASPLVLASRGIAGGAWILVIEPAWLLLLAPVQLIVLILRRVSELAEDDETDDDDYDYDRDEHDRSAAHELVGSFASDDPEDGRYDAAPVADAVDAVDAAKAAQAAQAAARAAALPAARRQQLEAILATGKRR